MAMMVPLRDYDANELLRAMDVSIGLKCDQKNQYQFEC